MADVAFDVENKNPKELLGHGIRAYILQDFTTAVEALGKASELLVTEHKDDLHDSLGEVYFYYGKSLLGLAREESQPLGDAVPKNAEDSSSDSEDEGGDTEADAEAKAEDDEAEGEKNGTVASNGSSDVSAEAESSTAAEKVEKIGTVASESSPGPSSSTATAGSSTAAAEGDEEPTDLQVAWEVLELARKIYKKNEGQNKKNLAETLIALGEVSLESENFESAINDIKEGLEIQKTLYGNDSRSIAETYYNLGVAYSTNSQIDEAIESFQSSLGYLRNRIEVLEKAVEAEVEEAEEEIKEIKDLIPEIEEKINDMKSYKEETIKKITEAVKEAPKEALGASSSSKQASDISHLVKRKRKLDDVIEDKSMEESPAKKPAPAT